MQHVFIIGSKGIPGTYGGYETFVDKLTEYHQNNQSIKYHVACKNNEKSEYVYHNAHCFNIKVPNIGSIQAIYYDVRALLECQNYIKKNNIEKPIIYILACRIGPFVAYFQKQIHKMGGKIFVNPDGHEWMRTKWNKIVRRYWKLSEQMMVKYSDLMICDSKNIEKYIQKAYRRYQPNTLFIAYGADKKQSRLSDNDPKLINWYTSKNIIPLMYYLIVGRFVPENNFEIMIKEFMLSKSNKDLVIITTANDKFLEKLEERLHFRSDPRIKFVGTVYDQELLKKIRENAYGYFHGHEVGGTNPSLLEALSSTDLNLLLNVKFNKEVAEDSAVYWSKETGNLAELIEQTDAMKKEEKVAFGLKAKKRILDKYSWEYIAHIYEQLFLDN